MTIGWAGSVTSSTVIQVVLPKPLISLVPLIVIGVPTIGEVGPGSVAGAVGADGNGVADDQGGQVDRELAAAIGRGQKQIGIRR